MKKLTENNIKTSLSVAAAENLLAEIQSRDEASERLSAELEGSKEDVNRMMEELKNKEQEHAAETAELVNKNSELTEMLDDTMEKLDAAQEEVEEQASRLSETEVQPFISHCPYIYLLFTCNRTFSSKLTYLTTVTINHSFTLSFSPQNISFLQILPSTDHWYPPD